MTTEQPNKPQGQDVPHYWIVALGFLLAGPRLAAIELWNLARRPFRNNNDS